MLKLADNERSFCQSFLTIGVCSPIMPLSRRIRFADITRQAIGGPCHAKGSSVLRSLHVSHSADGERRRATSYAIAPPQIAVVREEEFPVPTEAFPIRAKKFAVRTDQGIGVQCPGIAARIDVRNRRNGRKSADSLLFSLFSAICRGRRSTTIALFATE
jgi:hypothetical protein